MSQILVAVNPNFLNRFRMKIDIEKIFSQQVFKKLILLLMALALGVNNAYSINYY